MEFAWIKPGRVTMVTLGLEIGWGEDEGSPHEAVLTEEFYTGTYEVIQEQRIAATETVP